jgi:hypothetical protein
MRSSISGKIPKRSESVFPNKIEFHFDLTPGCPRLCSEAIFVFQSNRRLMQRRDEQGRGGKSGGPATELLGADGHF